MMIFFRLSWKWAIAKKIIHWTVNRAKTRLSAKKKNRKCKSTKVNRRWTDGGRRGRQWLHFLLELKLLFFAWTFFLHDFKLWRDPLSREKLPIFFYWWWSWFLWLWWQYAMPHILVFSERTNQMQRRKMILKNLLLLSAYFTFF